MSSPPRPSKARTKSQVDADTAGGRLRDLRGDRTQDEVAAALGVSRANLSKYETGGLEPPDPVVKRAALYFGVTPAYIRYGDVQNRLVRISGYVGAGARIEAVQQTQGGRLVEVPSSWDDALALEIRGLSAYPVYDEGDVIVIRGEQRFDEAEAVGRLCVVETADGEGLLKRVRRGSAPGLYTLESLNAPPIEDVVLRSARPVKLDIRR